MDFCEIIIKEHHEYVSKIRKNLNQDVQIICQDGELWCSKVMLYFMEPSLKAVLLEEDNLETYVIIYLAKLVEDFIDLPKESSNSEGISLGSSSEVDVKVVVQSEYCDDKNFSCEVCGQRYGTFKKLQSHKWSKHTVGGDFKCNECGKEFKHRYELKKHMFKHMEPTFVCDFCGKRFKRREALVHHYKQLHQETTKLLLNCSECPKTFSEKSSLARHIKSNHSNYKLNCTLCNKTFTRHDALQRHLVRKHSSQ